MSSEKSGPNPTFAEKVIKLSPWIGIGFGVGVAGLIVIVNLMGRPETGPADARQRTEETESKLVKANQELRELQSEIELTRKQSGLVSQAVSELEQRLQSRRAQASNEAIGKAILPMSEKELAALRDEQSELTAMLDSLQGNRTELEKQHQALESQLPPPVRARYEKPASPEPEKTEAETHPMPPFPGWIRTLDGAELHGMVYLGKETLTLKAENGNSHQIKLEQIGLLRPQALKKSKPLLHGVRGTYFGNQQLRDQGRSRIDPVIDFDWKNDAPVPGLSPEDFSCRWEGQLEAPVSGQYVFFTESNDGVRLWINRQLLIDQWNNHSNQEHRGNIDLKAGQRYDLKMEHYEQGGTAVARLIWQPPGQPRSLVPQERLYLPEREMQGKETASTPLQGLRGTYYSQLDFQGESFLRFDPVIDFNWQGKNPIAGVGSERFTVRWEGEIEAPTTGEFTFYLLSDDGARLWIDGHKIIDHWSDHSQSESQGKVKLAEHTKIPIRLDYYENSGEAVARLFWSGPAVSREIIPSRCFSPALSAGVLERQHYSTAGVVLKGGSFLAGVVNGAVESVVQINAGKPTQFDLPLALVARIQFKSLTLNQEVQLTAGKRGVLLAEDEFVEGEFTGLARGKVTLNSVLLGMKSWSLNQVAAIVLREDKMAPAQFELRTASQSLIRANAFWGSTNGIAIQDNTLAQLQVPIADLVAIQRIK